MFVFFIKLSTCRKQPLDAATPCASHQFHNKKMFYGSVSHVVVVVDCHFYADDDLNPPSTSIRLLFLQYEPPATKMTRVT